MLPLSINVSQLLGEFLSRERERLGRKVLSSEFQQDLAAEMNLFLGKAKETPSGESTESNAPWVFQGTGLSQVVQAPWDTRVSLDGQALDEHRWQEEAKREVDENLLVADPLLLQKVLAQLHVPAETRMEVASRTGDEGTVSLGDLAGILKKALEDSHKRLPSATDVVPAVTVRDFLESVQWSGQEGFLPKDWAQAAATGDSNLEQMAELITEILRTAQNTRSKELAASAQDETADSPQASDTKPFAGPQAEPGVGAAPSWSGFAAVGHSDRHDAEGREGGSPLFTDERKEISDSVADALAPAPGKSDEAARKAKRGSAYGTIERTLRDAPRPQLHALEDAGAALIQSEPQRTPAPDHTAHTTATNTDQEPLSNPSAMALGTSSQEAAEGSPAGFHPSDSQGNAPHDAKPRTSIPQHEHWAPRQPREDIPGPFIADPVPSRPEARDQHVVQVPVQPEPQRTPATKGNPLTADTTATNTDQEILSNASATPLGTNSREATEGSLAGFHSSDSQGHPSHDAKPRTSIPQHEHWTPEGNPLTADTTATNTDQEPLSNPSAMALGTSSQEAAEGSPAGFHLSDSQGSAPADAQPRAPFWGHEPRPSAQEAIAPQTDPLSRAGAPSMEPGLTGTRPLEDVPAQDGPDGEESGSPRTSRLRARAHGMQTPEAGPRPSSASSHGEHPSQGFSQNGPWAEEHGTRDVQSPAEPTQKPNSIAFSVGSTTSQQAASPVSKAAPQSAGFSFSQAHWPQELADLLGRMSRERRHRMTLEVEPRHLGKITLRVETHGNYVSAWVQADHPDARDLLARNTAFLQNLLSEQGLQLSQFSVDVREHHRQSDGRFEGDPAPAHGTGTTVGPSRAKPTPVGRYAAPAGATISLRA